ncbi:hypothetical protein ElyMa_004888500 [Elysia marginata]|uniref:SMB domain-containing protein n=1 Tax=Elysia marginata TaxID=1093978 RepID=A0AAV4IW26_9GAST|nr:hypothetical protein ElyMa_004888500 [Elysia marginata]
MLSIGKNILSLVVIVLGFVEMFWFTRSQTVPPFPQVTSTPSFDNTGFKSWVEGMVNNRDSKQQFGDEPCIFCSTESLPTSARPWYLNDLARSENIFDTEQNQSETFDVEEKLMEIAGVLDTFGVHHAPVMLIVDGKIIQMSATSQLKDIVSDQSLCSQADLLLRSSCRGRCGQLPDTRDVPGQCACDPDCLLYTDCCEDVNDFCTDLFVSAVNIFYEQRENFSMAQCHRDESQMLPELYSAGQSMAPAETVAVKFECSSEVHTPDVLSDIATALKKSHCRSKRWSMDQVRRSRVCNRPDVLLCEPPPIFPLYSFYPVDLMCLNHPKTQTLVNRYFGGLEDMEVISKHGNCYHLRETYNLPTDYQNGRVMATNIWRSSYLNKIKLLMVPQDGQIYFHFETSDREKVKCIGGPKASDWRCVSNACSERQLFLEKSQTCYWPDRAYLLLTPLGADPQPEDDVHGQREDDTNNNIDTGDALEGMNQATISLCTCFKAQAVLSSVGWWAVRTETRALIGGRCSFKLDNTTQESVYAAYRNEDSHGRKMSGAIETRPGTNSSTASRVGNVYDGSFLLQKLITSWNTRRNECIEENFRAVYFCFPFTKLDTEPLCFLIHEDSSKQEKTVPEVGMKIFYSGCRRCFQGKGKVTFTFDTETLGPKAKKEENMTRRA